MCMFLLVFLIGCVFVPKDIDYELPPTEYKTKPYQEHFFTTDLDYHFLNFTQTSLFCNKELENSKFLIINLTIITHNNYKNELTNYDLALLDESDRTYYASKENFTDNLMIKQIYGKNPVNGIIVFEVPNYVEDTKIMFFMGMIEKKGVMGAYRDYCLLELPKFKLNLKK